MSHCGCYKACPHLPGQDPQPALHWAEPTLPQDRLPHPTVDALSRLLSNSVRPSDTPEQGGGEGSTVTFHSHSVQVLPLRGQLSE